MATEFDGVLTCIGMRRDPDGDDGFVQHLTLFRKNAAKTIRASLVGRKRAIENLTDTRQRLRATDANDAQRTALRRGNGTDGVHGRRQEWGSAVGE